MTLLEKVRLNQGATFTKNLGELITNFGYQVSIKDVLKVQSESVNDESFELILRGVAETIEDGEYIGVWVDNGLLYVDVSWHITHYHTAVSLGRVKNQKAIWDWHTMKNIWL